MGNNMKVIGLVVIALVLVGGGYALAKVVGPAETTQNTTAQMPKMDHTGHEDHAALVKDEKSFIQEMIPHHEEAISSSQELLKIAETPEVVTLANNIIAAQEKEVADMKAWYREWYGEEYQPTGNYKPMMTSLEGKSKEDAEQAYLHEMIMHHQAAVEMAEAIAPKAEHEEIKNLSKAIVATQNEEINQMKGLIQEDGHAHH
jgi:uncharacterized protein (DUF305 family)